MNTALAESGPEEWLVARARRGDQRAFEQLYRANVGLVYGLCLRMTRDPAHAEDCTQQAFIQAWQALPRFEARSVFATWMHRIAVNVVLMRRRGRAEAVVEAGPGDGADEEAAATFDTPVEVAEIEAAIGALPQGARALLRQKLGVEEN
jgi:RNA polymerase sigma-70 factor (ECF subfamily)